MQLSVIVPVYNMAGDGKLNYCLDSLLGQRITDYEIIAVDDASTDDSARILQEYESKYPERVRVIYSKENRRQGAARNLGIKAAKGKWIGFVDSDDWVHPDMYRKLLAKAEETGADIVGCQYHLTNEHSMEIGKVVQVHRLQHVGEIDDLCRKSWVRWPGSMVVKMYLKEVVDKYNLLFPENVFYEDNCASNLWMMRFTHFEMVDEPLYYYYQHPNSTVHVVTEERCRQRMQTAVLLLEEFKKQGFYKEYKEELEERFTQIYYMNTLFSYLQATKWPSLGLVRELRKGMLQYFPDFQTNRYNELDFNKEESRLIALHMEYPGLFVLYYKALQLYRKIRYKKK